MLSNPDVPGEEGTMDFEVRLYYVVFFIEVGEP